MSLSYSVVVPVLAEEALVNPLVDHIRTVGYGRRVEIIIADGDPGRSTIEAITRAGVLAVPAPRGRARQMNAGARQASGDVLLFLHADCSLPAGAFEAIDELLADSTRQAGAFDLGIRSESWTLKLVAAMASLRSRLSRTPYGDQGIFVTRAAFEAVGGYADLPILEDVDLIRRLRRAGFRLGFARGKVTTLPRRWEADGVWRRTFTNWAIMVLYLLGVAPEKLTGMHPPRNTGERP